MDEQLLLAFIDHLEEKELKLLTWGMVDYRFTATDIEREYEIFFGTNPPMAFNEFKDELVKKHFLFQFSGDNYRSRTAEIVRLISRLKQLLDKHKDNDSWPSGKNLVGDFRFIKRKRQRPDRNQVSIDQLMEELSDLSLTSLQKEVLTAIIGQRSLAGFQSRAIKAILSISDSENRDSDGVLISAGTGSGKTLAFYIPVILSIVRNLKTNPTHHTKCVAIYPRNELLKDQIIELLRLLHYDVNPILQMNKIRPIRAGAFFGQTPMKNDIHDYILKDFPNHQNGKIIPFLNCPNQLCEGNLYWSDIARDIHVARCTNCNFHSLENEIEITRVKIVAEPPDILFTSTEMLNRHLSNYSVNKIWGISQQYKPNFILFDEVHTYNGNHGAGVSYLLQRYLKYLGAKPVVAGLSATLTEGKRFFARFANLDEARTLEVAPERGEMIKFGAEYKMVLRNDPTERVQLLSTTTQLLMLLRRVMDKKGESKYFGDKVFAFTDDLDAVNRLLGIIRDADNTKRLARIRTYRTGESLKSVQRRFFAGQLWQLSHNMGFNLKSPLKIDRTTSQDTGVSKGVDVVVATASLEVGYNDKGVGVVVQHKTPRTATQLIQREGRAGRTDIMRPWTVVTLSDFGIDRATFQSYEQLFDPILEPNSLPLENLNLIKIQSVYAFLEWLALRLKMQGAYQDPRGIWKMIEDSNGANSESIQRNIKSVLLDEFVFAEFKNYLIKSLSLNEYLIDKILWEPPRSLMLIVLPTILRRLETNWKGESKNNKQYPLSEFLPSTLFTDLNLPELEIIIGDDAKNPIMNFLQGIIEYAPGNVSARHTIQDLKVKHWIPIDYKQRAVKGTIDIDNFINISEAITYSEKTIRLVDSNKKFLFIRPKHIKVESSPTDVRDYSRSSLEWRTTIEHDDVLSFSLDIPEQPWIRPVISTIDVHLHSNMRQLTIDRMAIGVNTSTAVNYQDERIEKYFTFISKSKPELPIAYGSKLFVDGIKFRFNYPEQFYPDDPNLQRHLRRQYFRYKIKTAHEITRSLNIFDQEILEEFLVYSLITRVFNYNESMTSFLDLLGNEIRRNELIIQFTTYFGDPSVEVSFGDDDYDSKHGEFLIQFFNSSGSFSVVESLLEDLLSDVKNEIWLRDVFKTTLGTLVLETIKRMIGDVLDTDLILDITDGLDRDIRNNEDCFYISESAPGSTGVIEKFIETYNREPRLFFKLLLGTSSPEEEELIDVELKWLLRRDNIPELFANYRDPNADFKVKDDSLKRISETLQMNGHHSTHMIMSSIVNRLLFPGSSPASDNLALQIHKEWENIETRLGFEVDSRVFADVLASNNELRKTISETLSIPVNEQQLISAAFYRFLWPKGGTVRNRVLSSYNPFNPAEFTDKLILFESFHMADLPQIDCVDEQYQDVLQRHFVDRGGVLLKMPVKIFEKKEFLDNVENKNELPPVPDVNPMKRILHGLIINPIEFDVLLEYPRINRIELNNNNYMVEITSRIIR